MQKITKKWLFIGIVFVLLSIYGVVKVFLIDPYKVSYWIVFDKGKNVQQIIHDRCVKMKFNKCVDIIEKESEIYVGINDGGSIKEKTLDQISESYKSGIKSKIWKGTRLVVSNVSGFDTIVNIELSNLSVKNEIKPKYGIEIDFTKNIDSTKAKKLDNGFEVRVYLDEYGRQKFMQFTKSQIEKKVAIKIDSTVLVMPVVKTEISDGQIPIYLDKSFGETIDIAEALEQRTSNQLLVIKRIVLE